MTCLKERKRIDGGTDHIKVWGEEHWTQDMMNTVMEFTEEESKVDKDDSASAAPSKPLNKRDRKNIKRTEQLRLRAVAAASSSSANASTTTPVTKEPEEEP